MHYVVLNLLIRAALIIVSTNNKLYTLPSFTICFKQTCLHVLVLKISVQWHLTIQQEKDDTVVLKKSTNVLPVSRQNGPGNTDQ